MRNETTVIEYVVDAWQIEKILNYFGIEELDDGIEQTELSALLDKIIDELGGEHQELSSAMELL